MMEQERPTDDPHPHPSPSLTHILPTWPTQNGRCMLLLVAVVVSPAATPHPRTNTYMLTRSFQRNPTGRLGGGKGGKEGGGVDKEWDR
jgi:hypothetical protein